MKLKLSILILIISLEAWGKSCPEVLTVNLETGVTVDFCERDGHMVSKECFQASNCVLLKELDKKKKQIIELRPMHMAHRQNPGSFVCGKLGWNVLMGKINSSQICVCEHPTKNQILCTSLLNVLYKKK